MNGPIAQAVALVCHGNALMRGIEIPQFFPENSTCKFCDSVGFIVNIKTPTHMEEGDILESPDVWFTWLKKREALCLRLCQFSENDSKISERMSAGFIGGGKTWIIEVVLKNGTSEFWSAQWNVWNQEAPESRIWRVSYALFDISKTRSNGMRSLDKVRSDFQKALIDIHEFSKQQDCGVFTSCFEQALKALDEPDSDIGYHKDLFLPGSLMPNARSMLKAAMSAWVFGGMGSWNDIYFNDDVQKEYEQVSNALFETINEAISVAATSSADF